MKYAKVVLALTDSGKKFMNVEKFGKGPSINYVVSVGGGVSSKDDLLNRPYLKKRPQAGSKIADFETT